MKKIKSTSFVLLYSIMLIALHQFTDANIASITPEDTLNEMGITLYEPSAPCGSYVLSKRVGNLVYLSGNAPKNPEDGQISRGKLGINMTTKEGNIAARNTGIHALSVLKKELGDLSRVKNVVKITGYINSDPNFTELTAVMNGYCDLMVDVFGEKGKSPRSSIGVATLPYNKAMVIEVIIEVSD